MRRHLREQARVDLAAAAPRTASRASGPAGTRSGRARCPRPRARGPPRRRPGTRRSRASTTARPSSVTAGSVRSDCRRSSSARSRSRIGAEAGEGGSRGLDDHHAAGAVDHHDRPRSDAAGRVPQADHGRHAEGAREDRRVVRGGALVRRDRQHALPVELGGLRRREARRPPARSCRAAAPERGRPPPRPGSAARGRPRRRGRCRARGSSRRRAARTGPWSSSATVRSAHSALTCSSRTTASARSRKQRVVEHQQVGVEDVPVRAADVARQPVLDALQLDAGRLHRAQEPLGLRLHRLRREAQPHERHGSRAGPRPPGRWRRPATRRCPRISPVTRPPRTRCRPAPPARRSPPLRRRPRPRASRRVPCAAASSRMPRIDLPSMVRSLRRTVIRARNWLAVCTKRAAARACMPSRFTTATSRVVTGASPGARWPRRWRPCPGPG